MIDVLRKVLYLSGRATRRQWLAVVVLAVVVSLVEASGTFLIALLLGLLAGDGDASLPVVGDIQRYFPGTSDARLLLTVGVAVGVFFVFRSLAILCQHYVQYRVAESVGAQVATRLLAGYLSMPAERHVQRNSSELVRNVSDSVIRMVSEGLVPGVQLLAKLSMVVGICLVLLLTNALATLGAVAVIAPATWVVLRAVQPRVKRLGRTAKTMIRNNLQSLQESLAGWRDIRILGREHAFVEAYARDRRRLARTRYLQRTAAQVPRVSIETSIVLFIAAFVGVATAAGNTQETLPVLGLFGYAAVRLMPEMNTITHNLNSLRFVGPAVDDIYEDMVALETTTAAPGHVVPHLLQRAIVLDAVSYRYPGARRDALHDIDIEIRAGQSVGIVGATGGGKSTLVDVLLGLLEPAAGRVLVDGIDIRDMRREWHASIGMVPQAIFLVDDTIERNIALGVPDAEIDHAAVAEAVRLAQLEGFVDALPDGLHTRVGERGTRLSGGQRQRLAIARALYRRPSVLIFDEGTSALDNETEQALLQALERLQGGRTTITVAHRLTTVRNCDLVLLMKDGRVADRGTFRELELRNASLRSSLV